MFSLLFIFDFYFDIFSLYNLFQDVIDFAKDIGLQSSVAVSRTAATKLLGALHKFVGPGIFWSYSLNEDLVLVLWLQFSVFVADLKAFVSDVKPALQSALDAEFEKNPYEVELSELIIALEDQLF